MGSARTMLIVAIALLMSGGVAMALQPVVDPKPDTECVAEGEPSSGFTDDAKDNCPVSQKSAQKIAAWESKPKPLRIAGLVLALGGIVSGIAAFVARRKSR